MRELAGATWPQAAGAGVVVVPMGSIEQHGPHLPLDTDAVIATAVAQRVVDALPGALLAPALPYGASGEHQSFPGTSSIGGEALQHTIVELVRSIRTWAGRVVIVNGHGGNVAALGAAVDQLVAEGHDVAWVACQVAGGDAHAGRTETSVMLYLAPWSVRRTNVVVGNVRPLAELLPDMREGGVHAVSRNGVLGDPRGATAEEGARILAAMVEHALTRVQETAR